MASKSVWTNIYKTLASVKTGIILIIVVGLASAVGTVILQRPATDPVEMKTTYSPETLALLDRLGLTDVFHSWWFLTLLCLFCLCLVCVSLERWPNSWKMYARPVRFASPAMRASLPQSAKFAVKEEAGALDAAERVLRRFGLKAQRVTENGQTGLFAERQRFSVFAVYLVHLSLLFIFAGYIVDGIVGYRGNINVPEGQALGQMTVRDNYGNATLRKLPFLIRCDGAGEETYPDGSPKKWWSTLTILDNGEAAVTKTIVVNDPLVYKGIHIYQSSMGQSPVPKSITFAALEQGVPVPPTPDQVPTVEVPMKGQAQLPDGETLSILRWVPDYYVQDKEVYTKSEAPRNPAILLGLTNTRGETKKLWIFPSEKNSTEPEGAHYVFAIKSAKWGKFTGLEIAHHPGQFGVWAGVVLMAIGLVIAFYTQHVRAWALVTADGAGGRQLWIGAAANKNRDRLEIRFRQIKSALAGELIRTALLVEGDASQPGAQQKETLSKSEA
jgi:cytochrome c biogenesis protein